MKNALPQIEQRHLDEVLGLQLPFQFADAALELAKKPNNVFVPRCW